MSQLLSEVRFALRTLARDRGFSLTVLATFALGVAANVAIFAVVHAVLLRPLPFSEPDRLVVMFNSYPRAGVPRAGNSIPHYLERSEHLGSLQGLAALRGRDAIVGEAGRTQRVEALRVTPNFFEVLGVGAQLGRTFRPEEGEEGRDQVALLSHGFWQQHLGGDPAVVGRTLRVDGVSLEVVGVMPPGFRFDPEPETRLWTPLAFRAEDRQPDRRHSNNLNVIGRLAPGATVARLQEEVDAFNLEMLEGDPYRQPVVDAGFRTEVATLPDDLTRHARSALWLLQAGALFVLLIGGVNLANLMLVRGNVRAREVAIRRVLGAGRLRVARQLLIENTVLALGGAMAGLALGAALLPMLDKLGLAELPRGGDARVDWVVAAAAIGIALVTGWVLALPPLAHHLGERLGAALSVESRGGTTNRRQGRLREALMVAQVALAFVLLSGAGLLTFSFSRILQIDPGFRPERLLTAQLNLPRPRYAKYDDRRAYVQRLLAEVGQLPGVMGVAVSSAAPFAGDSDSNVMMPEGYEPAAGESVQAPYTISVAGDFFSTFGVPLRDGRLLTAADGDAEPLIAVIDERYARRYWPNSSPVGRRIVEGTGKEPDSKVYSIVGVVGSVKQSDLAEPVNVGAIYLPYRLQPTPGMVLTVRTDLLPAALAPALQAAALQVDPEVPLFDVKTMNERVATSLGARRTPMVLAAAFAGGALLLSVVGIYGVLAYTVSQRRREIGIRLALGASPAQVHGMFLRLGGRLLLLGLVLGVPLALWMGGSLRGQLVGMEPTNPMVLGFAAGCVGIAALLASVLPARRAAATPAVEAMRAD